MQTQRLFTKYAPSIPTIVTTKLDVSQIKDGDVAGLAIFQDPYAFIAVTKRDGQNYVEMINNGIVITSSKINKEVIYLRATASNKSALANFAYGTDNKHFQNIGNNLEMKFNLKVFTGNKVGLFNFATKESGGYVDFDWCRME